MIERNLTIKSLWSIFSSGGIGSAPHEIATPSFIRHVPLRTSIQESSRETSQEVRPGRGRTIYGAPVYPRCHRVHLHEWHRLSEVNEENDSECSSD